MSKKDIKLVDAEAPKPTEDEGMQKLKSVASKFKKYMNAQYNDSVAYTPDTATIAKVTVSKWLKMPTAFSEAIQLPGLPFGNITHVYGKPNTGKTTMLMEAISQAQKQGILPILILTEHKFDFTRLPKFMGADPEAILVFHADSIEQAYGFMEKILRDLSVGQIVIEGEEKDEVMDMTNQDCFIFMDSLGNTMSESEMEYDHTDWDKSMGKPAKAIKNLTKRINHLLSKVRQRCGILLLNQSYQSMPMPPAPSVETPYGGDGAPYSCALNIRLRRVRDLSATVKGKDLVIGLETKIEVKKNHISHVMAISTVYTVASGMLPADKAALEDFKKNHIR
jgi:RecA/RadA recombinase